MKKVLIALMIMAVLLAGCTSKKEENKKLVVCCGAGLMKPMNGIDKEFRKKNRCKN